MLRSFMTTHTPDVLTRRRQAHSRNQTSKTNRWKPRRTSQTDGGQEEHRVTCVA